MAISAVTSSANAYAYVGNTNIAMTSPTGTTTGDLLMCLVAQRQTTDGVTQVADTATGTLTFTKLTFSAGVSSCGVSIWYRVVQAGDPTGWTVTTVAHAEALLMSYRGVDTTTPIDAQGTGGAANTATPTFNAVTTVTANAWYVGVMGYDDGVADLGTLSSGAPTPVLRADAGNGGNAPAKQAATLIDAAISAAGSTGAFVYTFGGSHNYATYSFALRPAGANTTQNLSSSLTQTVALPLATGHGLAGQVTPAGAVLGVAARAVPPHHNGPAQQMTNAAYRL